MKKCFKCGKVKSLDCFYKHKKMSDGHLNKCKECAKKDVRENRKKNIEYYRAYDSWRYINHEQVRERHKKYQSSDKGKKSVRKADAKYVSNNPEKRLAHTVVGNAVRSGKLIKPKTCPVCGEWKPSRKIHAHHDDYSKPLDVRWMCSMCHTIEHGRGSPFRKSEGGDNEATQPRMA